jgi:transcriptional regulator with XRE-family HTH domain
MRINVAALTSLREMAGMSQTELARRSGVAQTMVSAVERGARQASPATVKKLAEALGVPIPAIAAVADEPEAVGQ